MNPYYVISGNPCWLVIIGDYGTQSIAMIIYPHEPYIFPIYITIYIYIPIIMMK